MMYNDELKCEVMPNEGIQPLIVVIDKTTNLATDALQMARKINLHLFGNSGMSDTKERQAKCLAEVLGNQSTTLLELCEELAKMMACLGV